MRNPLRALFEQRSVATSHDLMSYLLRGQQSVSGQTVNEATAFNVAAVQTCVSLRSRALASLPVRVYERLDERNKRPASGHDVSKVLSQPNSWQTRAELFGMLEAHRVLRGNAYAWINRTSLFRAGSVKELVPMHPDRVEVLDGDEFGGPSTYKLHTTSGKVLTFASREVLHLKGLSTDGRKGRSVLQDLRELVGGALATQEHGNSLWSRGATPNVVLKYPGELDEEQIDKLERHWEQTYGGSNKRRVAVLEDGMDMTPISLSPEDGQFLETRKFQRSEIAGAFHVPPHMIGDTEKSTSWGTGIQHQQIGFLVFTLRPDLVLWEQRLTRDLIDDPERFFIEFDLKGYLRGDSTERANFYWRMIQMGAMSPNEVRALENMNPIDEGDIYLQPVNMGPLGSDPFAAGKGTTE